MALRNENFSSFRQVDGGLNVTLDPQDIDNSECADIQNMIFRNGYPESRSGSSLYISRPSTETNALLNLFRPRDSSGNNYLVVAYAPNFYVWDELNGQLIQINNNYNPSATYKSYPYGYATWNYGKGTDTMYLGNGKENCMKWPVYLRYTTAAISAGASTITVDDGSYFPASGYIVIQAFGYTPQYIQYSSVTGNVINLTATTTFNIPSGAGVASQILNVPAGSNLMPQGNIFAISGNSLCVSGVKGSETTVFGSVENSPEDFTSTGAANSGWSQTIMAGNGPVLGLVDFGEYLLASKADGAYKLVLSVNEDAQSGVITTSLVINVNPVFSDVSLGPANNSSMIKKNNDLLFATLTEGLYSLTPGSTGDITSVEPTMLASNIYRLYTSLNFSASKAVSYDQFVLWTAATNSLSDTVVVLDLLKSDSKQKYVWSVFNNWNVQDWAVYKNLENEEILLFGNRIDNNIYQAFSSGYTDLQTGSSTSTYECSFLTKRFDYGFSPIGLGQPENSRAMISYFSHPDKIKVADLLHVQGYITNGGTLYIDIMYNENGIFTTITKKIDAANDPLVIHAPTTAMAMAMLGIPTLGGSTVNDFNNLAFVNEYVPLPIQIGFKNIQFRFYTTTPGIHMAITGFAYNGRLMDAVHPALVQADSALGNNNTSIPTYTPSGSNLQIIPVKSWVFDYTPTQPVISSNLVYTVPNASQVVVYADGVKVKGNGVDYTFSGGNTITFTSGSQPDKYISLDYLPQ